MSPTNNRMPKQLECYGYFLWHIFYSGGRTSSIVSGRLSKSHQSSSFCSLCYFRTKGGSSISWHIHSSGGIIVHRANQIALAQICLCQLLHQLLLKASLSFPKIIPESTQMHTLCTNASILHHFYNIAYNGQESFCKSSHHK